MPNSSLNVEMLNLLGLGGTITEDNLTLEDAVKILNSRRGLRKDVADDGKIYYRCTNGCEIILDPKYGKVSVEVRYKWEPYAPRIKTDD